LLLNAKLAIFQVYHGENKLQRKTWHWDLLKQNQVIDANQSRKFTYLDRFIIVDKYLFSVRNVMSRNCDITMRFAPQIQTFEHLILCSFPSFFVCSSLKPPSTLHICHVFLHLIQLWYKYVYLRCQIISNNMSKFLIAYISDVPQTVIDDLHESTSLILFILFN